MSERSAENDELDWGHVILTVAEFSTLRRGNAEQVQAVLDALVAREIAAAVKPQVLLGQIGEHVEPGPCRDCGKSASACGRSGSFCCNSCAGQPGVRDTSFLTHQPSIPPGSRGDA